MIVDWFLKYGGLVGNEAEKIINVFPKKMILFHPFWTCMRQKVVR